MITLCFPLICVKCNNVPAEKGTILKRGLKRCLELGPFPLKMSESVESGRRDNGVGSEGSRSLRLAGLLPILLCQCSPMQWINLSFNPVARTPNTSGESRLTNRRKDVAFDVNPKLHKSVCVLFRLPHKAQQSRFPLYGFIMRSERRG